jgi:heterodisulfide reductase subunit C
MTPAATIPVSTTGDFADQVELASAANLSACLQCRKCSSGCPVAARADIKCHELVRLVQLDQRDEVLASRMIWECTSCQTCASRCPQKVDIAALNDALRQMARAAGLANPGTSAPAFNDIFLAAIRRSGRVDEMGLMVRFKLRTWNLLADMGKFPTLLLKGKLPLLPRLVRRGSSLKELFRRAARSGGRP